MQNTEFRDTELRPLGAGELLDRAVTLFVRNFVPIVIVLAVVIVPIIVFQAVSAPKSGQVFTDLGRVFSAAGNREATAAANAALARDGGSNAHTVELYMVSVAARLLMWSAIVAVIAGAYAGARVTFGRAYLVGVVRWPQQLVVMVLFVLLGLVTIIPLVIVYLLVAIMIGLISALSVVGAVIVGIVGGLLVFAAFTVVLSWLFMTYALASVAVVTETRNPFTAVGIGLGRGFARGMRWRTVVGGLVVFVVGYLGALPVIAVAAAATSLTHVDVLYFAIAGVGSVLLEGLVAAFVVVFAVDARVRREGFDIIAASA